MLMPSTPPLDELENSAEFVARHLGVSDADEQRMLQAIGVPSRRALIDAVVPRAIARSTAMKLPAPVTEAQALAELRGIAQKNRVLKSFIGQGYHGTHTPGVILRNILENPAWYTAYTPYQAEISQGRMEALVNFQTMVTDLTGMAIANASMLDEATAAAEAMTLAKRSVKSKSHTLVVAGDCHPQTLDVLRTRAEPLGITVQVTESEAQWDALIAAGDYFAALIQVPATDGSVYDLRQEAERIHAHQAAFIVGADLLALTLITPPGEYGADIAYGTTQRFGVPMANGGPHAAYMACRDEFKRSMPGRLVGVSIDSHGAPAYRLALQTREQHIRREKATSNICTAQVLLAVIASMYAVYHGPSGLRRIAQRVARYTAVLAAGLEHLGVKVSNRHAFDTLSLCTGADSAHLADRAEAAGMNLRRFAEWGGDMLGITLDETTTRADIEALWQVFAAPGQTLPRVDELAAKVADRLPADLRRRSEFLTHPVFNSHHSETAMLRYIRSLSDKDISLDRAMIPLGSCTMKLNATTEMVGMSVVVVKCDAMGNVDIDDLRAKCEQHTNELAAVMITYPSTYGVFDTRVKELCAIVHQHGGRVYVDGANMNALVGVAAPGEFGGDVSHLNLHKTFCIPHGGGGPGVGPVCVVDDLVPFLPTHPATGHSGAVGAVSAAPLGNAAVLPISWMYVRMMGTEGLTQATETAILSANYVAARLAGHYEIRFSGGIDGVRGGGVAHECILDIRPLQKTSGVGAEDVAKRLIDYGFHAPTLSFPVAGTLMVEPTESESLAELDRFCDAMIAIRGEIAKVEAGTWPQDDNPLKNAPHTAAALLTADWSHPYSREEAAYPLPALRRSKYWSPVGRIDNVHGDRNLFCSCVPVEQYASTSA